MTLRITDTQHNRALSYARRHYAGCRVLFIVMLSVVRQNVVMLSVVAPRRHFIKERLNNGTCHCLFVCSHGKILAVKAGTSIHLAWLSCLVKWTFHQSMRENQLPVSAARWQHWSQICFCSFYLVKNHKIANNAEAREKISTYLESRELSKFLMYVWLNLKTFKFYFMTLATDF